MPTYKLTYFNITGLGEGVRYLLHQSGVQFEDKRLTFDEWPKHKNDMPMHQVPVLEIDGKQYHQSKAICRYIARTHNLYGSNEIEGMVIDSIADTIDDLRVGMSQYYWEQDSALKAKLKEKVFEKLPFCLEKLEEQVKKNGGHFVGGKLTWVDLYYASFEEYLSMVIGHPLNKDHPELDALVKKVRALPAIKAYLAARPKCQF